MTSRARKPIPLTTCDPDTDKLSECHSQQHRCSTPSGLNDGRNSILPRVCTLGFSSRPFQGRRRPRFVRVRPGPTRPAHRLFRIVVFNAAGACGTPPRKGWTRSARGANPGKYRDLIRMAMFNAAGACGTPPRKGWNTSARGANPGKYRDLTRMAVFNAQQEHAGHHPARGGTHQPGVQSPGSTVI